MGAPTPSSRRAVAWEWWKRKAHALGVFQTRMVLTLFYILVFAPVACIVRLSKDPLDRSRRQKYLKWRPRRTRDRTMADLLRQS